MSSSTTATGLTDHSKGGGHVLVDKDSLVKYDGGIMWYGEFFECAKGYYYSLKEDDRKYACTRVKAQLFGQARDLTVTKDDITAFPASKAPPAVGCWACIPTPRLYM